MLFSVVIAVRNEKNYISRCLDGIFSQDIKEEYEVIVVDGGSTDGTYELLKKIKKKYNIILIENKKANAAAGRNLGIKKSKGKLIAFIDGDAIPEKNWLRNIRKLIEKYDDKIAGVGGPDNLPNDSTKKARRIGYIMTSPIARGGRFNPSTQHSLQEEERYADHIPTCNLCLKKEIFKKVGVFDEDFVKGQDLELNYRIIKAGYKLVYSPKIKVVHYRKNHIRNFVRQIYKWAKAKVAIIKKHGIDGLISHVYLWPIYSLISLIISFIFFILVDLKIFSYIFFIGAIIYYSIILIESINLSKRYNEKGLIYYGLLLFPILHLTYFLGVFSATIKKKIW